jgi:hypothetical protein
MLYSQTVFIYYNLQPPAPKLSLWSEPKPNRLPHQCLVENQKNGTRVTSQYLNPGKHFVEFRLIGGEAMALHEEASLYMVEGLYTHRHQFAEFKEDEILDSVDSRG